MLQRIATKFKIPFTHRRSVRKFGGYIEDAQITQFGLEVYQEKFGLSSIPSAEFVIPTDDDSWPYNLWGYALGKGVLEHISKHDLIQPAQTKVHE